MIYMHQFIPQGILPKTQLLQGWAKLQKGQIFQAYYILKDTVPEFLRRQMARGKWREVQEVLKGKPMTPSGQFIFKQLRTLVTGKLMWHLDIKKVVAVALVLALLPVILAQLTEEQLRKNKR